MISGNILNDSRKRNIYYFIGIVVVLGLACIPYVTSSYVTSVIFLLFIYTGYALGWNIMSGLTGYINFGYSLFIGIASYVSVFLIIDLKLFWPVAWICGGISTSIVSVFLGSFMLKLRGSYFAIGMLALLIGTKILCASKYLTPITRGGYGFAFIEPLSLKMMYFSGFIITIFSAFLSYKIITSKFGAKLIAIREDEIGAGSIGINTERNKLAAFVTSGFISGLVASAHISFQNYIDPESAFNVQLTISPIVMVLLGGPGSVYGPIIGSILLTFIEEFLWSHFTHGYMMIYGVVMILLVLLMPGGIIEWLKEKEIIPKVRFI